MPVNESTDPMKPEVTKHGLASLQVCVPAAYTNEQAEAFANEAMPTGIDSKWQMRKNGDPALAGANERVKCLGRAGCVHIMLDC